MHNGSQKNKAIFIKYLQPFEVSFSSNLFPCDYNHSNNNHGLVIEPFRNKQFS